MSNNEKENSYPMMVLLLLGFQRQPLSVLAGS